MKLIDLLVQELPKWGGWPEGVDAVEQDSEGQLFEIDSDYCSDFKLEKCDDWIADVVTKQQYESALAASKAVVGHDEWIEWGGGKCPVEKGTIVDVRYRDGLEISAIPANDDVSESARDASRTFWRNHGSISDIIAYRIHNLGVDHRAQYEAGIEASDDWIEWHGGDCPVDSDAIVEVKFRWHDQHQYNNDRAGDFYWSHTGSNADIIAYRLQQPTKSEQAFDDVAGTDDEADLNECIGQDIDVFIHPSHYTKGRIECIDAIDSATTGKSGIEAVCVANIIKYLYRYEEKNGIEDVKKAKWYLNKLISELESK